MTTPYTPLSNVTSDDAADSANTDVFVLPASFAQQRLWLVDQFEPGRPTYNIPFNLRLRGMLDVRALEGALTRIVERHETLRTVFDAPEGEPMQVVLPPQPVALPVTDLSALPEEERESELSRIVHAEGNRAFDLRRGPIWRATLVRLASDDHALVLTVHHIAADGWSLGVLQRELEIAYNTLVQGAEPLLPELPVQYADFAIWQRDQLQGEALDRQLGYWLDKLRRPLPVLDIVTDRPRVGDGARRAGRVAVHVPLAVASALRALGREVNATPYTVLLAAYQLLLYRYTGESDIMVGSPTAGRTRHETEGLIGFFVNTLVLRTDLSGAPSFRELLGRVHDTVVGALAHQDMPFDKLVEVLEPKRDRTRGALVQTIFSLQDMPNGGRVALDGLAATKITGASGTAKFDLQLLLHSAPDGFSGTFEFDTDLFDQSTAEWLVRHYVALLHSIAANPDVAIDALDLVDDDERQTLLERWAGTAPSYPRDALVHELFAERAATAPDAIAATCAGASVTYAELDARSSALAAYLQSLGVGPGVRVAVCVDRSLGMLVAILGVLKCGAAYVPVDPHYPGERIAFMLADATAPVVLVQPHLAAAVLGALESASSAPDPRVVMIRDDGAPAPEWCELPFIRPLGATAVSPAYVMYTSGSTGRPKGVVVPHRAIVRLVRDSDFAQLDASQIMLGFAPISFDASTLEIWGALLNGGRLALSPPGRLSPVEVAELVEREGVTVMWLTAALFQQVVDMALPRLRHVRQLLAGGDVLPMPAVRRVLDELPGCRLINGYGPTENTTFTCCHPVPRDLPRDRSVPIGRPIANTRVYVLDASLRPAPVGVPGELYAGGDGVALGYHERPELTAERFLPDPFSGVPGTRMYRTGDRVRWLTDGTIEFLGRFDQQVKLRGFRVEPGEVEAVLGGHPAVRECAAAVRREDGEARLVAYYAVRDGAALAPAEVRTYLAERLPEYMVPGAVVSLPALPVGPTGKLDRAALPAPETPAPRIRTRAPRTTLEHEIAHIWESLLPGREIGIDDDFFELGGHSLLAARMLHALEQVRGQRVPLAALFDGATIERLAARLEAAAGSEAEPDVVVLQDGGAATPFVFVHGDVRGGGWYCRRLAPMLGRDTPLIVLPTLRAAPGAKPLTIESMAALHVATVRAKQPHGPYRLGGFCAGGLVAFEMARQLAAAGERVERLVLIDATGTNVRFRRLDPLLRALARGPSDEARLERRAALLRDLRYYSGRWRSVRRQPASNQLRWLATLVRRRFGTSRNGSEASGARQAVDAAPTMEFLERPATQLLKFQERAAVSYIPRPFSGSIDLIWASEPMAGRAIDPTRGWSRVAASVRVHEVASPHVGLITYNLPMLAERIRASLDGEDRAGKDR